MVARREQQAQLELAQLQLSWEFSARLPCRALFLWQRLGACIPSPYPQD